MPPGDRVTTGHHCTCPYHFNLLSCTFLDISPTFVVPLILSFLILSSMVMPLIHPSSSLQNTNYNDGERHRLKVRRSRPPTKYSISRRVEYHLIIILDGYPASLGFPIMHPFHAICTHSIIAMTSTYILHLLLFP